MKQKLIFCAAMVGVAVALFAATSTPILNGLLQSALNGGGQSVTNVGFLQITNWLAGSGTNTGTLTAGLFVGQLDASNLSGTIAGSNLLSAPAVVSNYYATNLPFFPGALYASTNTNGPVVTYTNQLGTNTWSYGHVPVNVSGIYDNNGLVYDGNIYLSGNQGTRWLGSTPTKGSIVAVNGVFTNSLQVHNSEFFFGIMTASGGWQMSDPNGNIFTGNNGDGLGDVGLNLNSGANFHIQGTGAASVQIDVPITCSSTLTINDPLMNNQPVSLGYATNNIGFLASNNRWFGSSNVFTGLVVVGGNQVVSNNLTVLSPGVITGNGSGITTLNASQLSSGTVATNRLPGFLPGWSTNDPASFSSGGGSGKATNVDNVRIKLDANTNLTIKSTFATVTATTGTTVIDCSVTNKIKLLLQANTTLTITNLPVFETLLLMVHQDSTGNRVLTGDGGEQFATLPIAGVTSIGNQYPLNTNAFALDVYTLVQTETNTLVLGVSPGFARGNTQ